MLKGTERYFNVPSGVSEYMLLSGVFIQRASTITAVSDLPFAHIKSAIGLAAFRTYIPGRLRFIKRTATTPAVGGFEIKQRKRFPAMRTPVVSEHHICKPEKCKNLFFHKNTSRKQSGRRARLTAVILSETRISR